MNLKASPDPTSSNRRLEGVRVKAAWPHMVTTVTTLIARGGQEDEIAREFARAFTSDGGDSHHLATLLIQQEDGLSFLVSHYQDHGELAAWRSSPGRQRMIAGLDAHSLRELCTIATPVMRIAVPSGGSGPKWKTLASTWIVTYPLLLAVIAALGTLAPGLPLPIGLALVSVAMSAATLWIVSPITNRLTRIWRLKGQQMRVEALEIETSA